MPITDRNLPAGTRLVAKYKGSAFRLEVLPGGEGYAFVDGTRPAGQSVYKSLSAAGSAVMGGTACNGWRFWSIEGEEAGAREEKPPRAARPPRAERPAKAAANGGGPKKAAKLIAKTPNQKGVAEGETRFFCNACMKSFTATSEPEACPEGHRADDAELTAPATGGVGK